FTVIPCRKCMGAVKIVEMESYECGAERDILGKFFEREFMRKWLDHIEEQIRKARKESFYLIFKNELLARCVPSSKFVEDILKEFELYGADFYFRRSRDGYLQVYVRTVEGRELGYKNIPFYFNCGMVLLNASSILHQAEREEKIKIYPMRKLASIVVRLKDMEGYKLEFYNELRTISEATFKYRDTLTIDFRASVTGLEITIRNKYIKKEFKYEPKELLRVETEDIIEFVDMFVKKLYEEEELKKPPEERAEEIREEEKPVGQVTLAMFFMLLLAFLIFSPRRRSLNITVRKEKYL
ncbi:MAG: hypothetical protein ACXQS5_00200, partial [Candidatus Methanospirareceae archaeon]